MKKAILSICLFAATFCATAQVPKDKSSAGVPEDDVEFVQKAAQAGMNEVKLGELALTMAASKDVKDLAKMMVEDHNKANAELKKLAATKKITLPMAVDDDGKDAYEDLAKKSGQDFDEAYAERMVKDHKKAVDLFEDEAKDGKDADIKAWAAKTLPTLKHHLEMARQIEDKVSKK